MGRMGTDLFINILTVSNENPNEDDTVDLTAEVRLFGMNVSGEIQVEFYLDDETNMIGMGSFDGTTLVSNSGEGINVTVSWKAVAGTHTIFAKVDPNNMIDEGASEAAVKNNQADPVSVVVTAKETSNDTSIILLVLVVLISIGSVVYIYKDSLFGK